MVFGDKIPDYAAIGKPSAMDLNEHLRQGISAHQRGDLARAEDLYRDVLKLAPGHADANHLMGLIRFQSGDPEAAAQLIETAIGLDNKVPLYHANLGRVLKAAGKDSDAVKAFKQAVHLEPDTAVLHADLSSALLGAGDADSARARANLALELDPDLAEAHLNLGLALQALKGPTHADAINAFNRAIALNPGLPGSYLGLGVALHENDQAEDAEKAYTQALALDSTFVEAHCNLGNLKRDKCAFSAAIQHYRDALSINPEQPEVWGNLGVAMQENGDLQGALDAYGRAVALDPGNAEIRRNRGMALLADSQFKEGWADYEHRWQTHRFERLRRDWPVPQWDGEAKEGLKLYVHAEQGLGDSIQFCRYLPLLADVGMKVTLECADVLRPIMKQLRGIEEVRIPGQDFPTMDAHVPLLSLPHLLETELESIPANTPYLDAPMAYKKKWGKIAKSWPNGKKIGIAWRGSLGHVRDHLRSPGLAAFMSLLELPDKVFVSLQKDDGATELASVSGTNQIIDPMDDVTDFADTAALMQELDWVISCDSAPLHLAGALDKKCIAVLPHVAEWRWGRAGRSTPWYPSMTLIRQPSSADWAGVFDEVSGLLR